MPSQRSVTVISVFIVGMSCPVNGQLLLYRYLLSECHAQSTVSYCDIGIYCRNVMPSQRSVTAIPFKATKFVSKRKVVNPP